MIGCHGVTYPHTARLESLAKEAMTSQKQDPSYLEVVAVSGGLWIRVGCVCCYVVGSPFMMERWSKSYYVFRLVYPSIRSGNGEPCHKEQKIMIVKLFDPHICNSRIILQPSQEKTVLCTDMATCSPYHPVPCI